MKSFVVMIGRAEYRVQRSPEPLCNEADLRVASLIDLDQRIIWLCPDHEPHEIPETVAAAVSEAWANQLRLPLVS